jgi:hypothetical protein
MQAIAHRNLGWPAGLLSAKSGNNLVTIDYAVSRRKGQQGAAKTEEHMTEATQPRMARGTRLPIAVVAAALFALLTFAPLANAASDPVGSGSATVTLNKGFIKYLKTFGIKVQKVSPAVLKGKKLTLPVTGGEVDPTTGGGTLNLGGGLKFKAGKKKATVKNLVIDTTKAALFAKVAGKNMKLASLKGWAYARAGFGVSMTVKKLKLTGKAAKQLNKKTGYAKGKPKPFIGGKVLGSAAAEEQPSTVTVLPGGNLTFNADVNTLTKLAKVQVKVKTLEPTKAKGLTSFEFPITGGTISPAGTAGVVQSAGGLELEQKLQTGPSSFLETFITLQAFYVDLAAKTITVEVIAKSNASEELNLGNLGRSSIADLTISGVVADPATRTVTIGNAAAALQPISAKVLNAFVEVYEGYEKGGGPPVGPEKINSGDPLGTFSFTVQTQ